MTSSPNLRSTTSLHTLATMRSPSDNASERSSLVSHSSGPSTYGVAPGQPTEPSRKKIIFNAGVKMAVIFTVGCLILGGTLWVALPRLEEVDQDKLRIPKSFEQLKDLNDLLKKYRDIYPFQILVCFVVTYLFLQLFSLPGSMYMSILAGAVWGVGRALPLCCACVATGSSLCYLLSSALGPALLTLPAIKTRMESFSGQVSRQRANIIPFLIVLRIAPLPPHWVVNMLCPHLGIGLPTFWISTFLGIFGVTVIHTTIGSGLDDMTSAGDFHLISWRNFFLLAAVVVGALIPVGIRYFFAREVQAAVDVEDEATPIRLPGEDDAILASGAPVDGADGASKKSPIIPVAPPRFVPSDSDSEFDSDMDEDVILEAGPALVLKPEDERVPPVASASSSPTPSSSRSSSSVP